MAAALGACGGNVVVDSESTPKSGAGGASTSVGTLGSGAGTPTSSSSSSSGVVSPAGGGGSVVGGGTGGAIVEGTGGSENVATSASASGGTCSTTCSIAVLFGAANMFEPPPCSEPALSDYQAVIACGCSGTCLSECGANLCTHMIATSPCVGCLMGQCPMALEACTSN
jgi:hypothetical protein